jgi:hypothetical protein
MPEIFLLVEVRKSSKVSTEILCVEGDVVVFKNSKTIKEPNNPALLTSQGRRDAEISVAAHGVICRTDSTNGVSAG